MMARMVPAYTVIPGHQIRIIVEAVDGGRAEVVGTVARVLHVATPSTVMSMEVTEARIRPLPAR